MKQYFSNLPVIYYKLNVGGEDRLFQLRDIILNVRVKRLIQENTNLYDLYDMEDGQKLEDISNELYGTPHYHWALMILNEKYDIHRDYSLSSSELEEYMSEKYAISPVYTGGDLSPAYYDLGYADDINDAVDDQRMINGMPHFVDGNGNVSAGFDSAGNAIQLPQRKIHRKILSDYSTSSTPISEVKSMFEIPESPVNFVMPVTNRTYEFQLNEAKRELKVLRPEVMSILIKDVERLMNE